MHYFYQLLIFIGFENACLMSDIEGVINEYNIIHDSAFSFLSC
jgi:hypothetical protein